MPDFLSEVSTLRPKLDSIFAEVQQNLPDIDFDMSDDTSEEDVPIFRRSLLTPTSEDGEDRELDAMLGEDREDLRSNQVLKPLHIDTDANTTPSQNPEDITEDARLASALQNFSSMFGFDNLGQGETSTSTLSSTDSDETEATTSAGDPCTPTLSSVTRPSTAPSMLRELDHRPTVKRDNWMNKENEKRNSRESIDTGKFSAGGRTKEEERRRDEEKRREVPELSPKEQSRKSANETAQEMVLRYLPTNSAILPRERLDIDCMLAAALRGETTFDQGDTSLTTPMRRQREDVLSEVERMSNSMPLIQKLAQMSMLQSGTELDNIDPNTGALLPKPKQPDSNKKRGQQKPPVSVRPPITKVVSSMGTSTSDLPNLPAEVPRKHSVPEKDTVYLDLRGFNKNKEEEPQPDHKQNFDAIQRILKINKQQESESDSSSEEESDDEEAGGWHEKRMKIKEALSKTGHLPETVSKPKPKKPLNVHTNLPIIQTHGQRLAGHLPPPKGKTTKAEPETEPEEEASVTKAPVVDMAEAERLRKVEIAKKVREAKEKERQSHIRLGDRLEALRPTLSIGGKHPAGESTPTLFDVEASYEPAPKSLPENESRETVLLTVTLSSPGEMVQHRTTHKSVDSGCGMSASYVALVTWLLSLVPDDTEPAQQEVLMAEKPAPFSVIGLQQMYVHSHLCLYVAIVPARPIVGKAKKGKGTLFQQAVNKYLASTTLTQASPWLQGMVSCELSSRSTGGGYTFPLPTVTTKLLSTYVQMSDDVEAAKKIFNLAAGFFWATLDTEEEESISCEYSLLHEGSPAPSYDTQNTMSLIYKKLYREPSSCLGILTRVLQLGLDLAGIRLLYPPPSLIQPQQPGKPSSITIGPVLALCLRGANARSVWLDALGPADPLLARRTDPNSLCALFGGESRADSNPLFAPRNPLRVVTELARWFGGRVPASGVVNVGTGHGGRPGTGSSKKKQKQNITQQELEQEIKSGPVSCLVATVLTDVLLLVSPLLPPAALGMLLIICQRRAYQLRGIRRLRLNTRGANKIGLSAAQVPVFSVAGSMPTSPTLSQTTFSFEPSVTKARESKASLYPSRPAATVLCLSKENATHNIASLIENFMMQLCLQGAIGEMEQQLGSTSQLTSPLLFHAMPYSDENLTKLGGDFAKTPEADVISSPGFIAPELHSNPELEQIVVLTFTGNSFMKSSANFLGHILGMLPFNSPLARGENEERDFELLGIKWLARLTLQQAKELTPYEVGTKQWKPSIHTLTTEPALVTVLRGVDAFRRVSCMINQRKVGVVPGDRSPTGLERIMSPSPELAYRQVTLFFRDRELFPDNSVRKLLPYLPPPRTYEIKGRSGQEECIIRSMTSGPIIVSAVMLIKPDALKKHLPKIMQRLALAGFSVAAFRHSMLDKQQVDKLIPQADYESPDLLSLQRQYLTSGPCLVLCLQRENAVKHLLDLVGPRDPKLAKQQDKFCWRNWCAQDAVRNGIHVSNTYQAAIEDLHLFFPAGLCCPPNHELSAENIPCPCQDALIGMEQAKQRVLRKQTQSGGRGLLQTVVALFTPGLMKVPKTSRSSTASAPYVEVLSYLHSEGFEMVGGRMIWFTRSQVEQYLHLTEAGSFDLADYLMSGPCLVLALERDNAVLAFDSHLGSSFDKDSVYSRYGSQIFRPKTAEQAEKQLVFFFDELAPSAQMLISTQKQTEQTNNTAIANS